MAIDTLSTTASSDDLLAGWCARIAGSRPRVALADGEDPRVIAAAAQLAVLGVVPVLIAPKEQVCAVAATAGVRLSPDIQVLSPEQLRAGRAGVVLDRRLSGIDGEKARLLRYDPLFLAAVSVPAGLADACVAGSTRSTSDVLRAALRVVGTAPGARCVTSSFLMVLPGGKLVAYGDCAVLPEPTLEELAEVAIATSHTFRTLAGSDPAVAMLSFSTKGSAEHASTELVRGATRRVGDRKSVV